MSNNLTNYRTIQTLDDHFNSPHHKYKLNKLFYDITANTNIDEQTIINVYHYLRNRSTQAFPWDTYAEITGVSARGIYMTQYYKQFLRSFYLPLPTRQQTLKSNKHKLLGDSNEILQLIIRIYFYCQFSLIFIPKDAVLQLDTYFIIDTKHRETLFVTNDSYTSMQDIKNHLNRIIYDELKLAKHQYKRVKSILYPKYKLISAFEAKTFNTVPSEFVHRGTSLKLFNAFSDIKCGIKTSCSNIITVSYHISKDNVDAYIAKGYEHTRCGSQISSADMISKLSLFFEDETIFPQTQTDINRFNHNFIQDDMFRHHLIYYNNNKYYDEQIGSLRYKNILKIPKMNKMNKNAINHPEYERKNPDIPVSSASKYNKNKNKNNNNKVNKAINIPKKQLIFKRKNIYKLKKRIYLPLKPINDAFSQNDYSSSDSNKIEMHINDVKQQVIDINDDNDDDKDDNKDDSKDNDDEFDQENDNDGWGNFHNDELIYDYDIPTNKGNITIDTNKIDINTWFCPSCSLQKANKESRCLFCNSKSKDNISWFCKYCNCINHVEHVKCCGCNTERFKKVPLIPIDIDQNDFEQDGIGIDINLDCFNYQGNTMHTANNQNVNQKQSHTDITAVTKRRSSTKINPICQYYGSVNGCLSRNKCKFNHNKPNSIAFCQEFFDSNRKKCPFGDQCKYRHIQFKYPSDAQHRIYDINGKPGPVLKPISNPPNNCKFNESYLNPIIQRMKQLHPTDPSININKDFIIHIVSKSIKHGERIKISKKVLQFKYKYYTIIITTKLTTILDVALSLNQNIPVITIHPDVLNILSKKCNPHIIDYGDIQRLGMNAKLTKTDTVNNKKQYSKKFKHNYCGCEIIFFSNHTTISEIKIKNKNKQLFIDSLKNTK